MKLHLSTHEMKENVKADAFSFLFIWEIYLIIFQSNLLMNHVLSINKKILLYNKLDWHFTLNTFSKHFKFCLKIM